MKAILKITASTFLIAILVLFNSCSKNNDAAPIVPSQINWTQTNGPFGGAINGLIFSGSKLLAGTDNGLFVSDDNGAHWTKSSLDQSIFYLAVNGNTVFAGTNANGIYISTDNGNTWAAANNGLTTTNLLSILISGNNIF